MLLSNNLTLSGISIGLLSLTTFNMLNIIIPNQLILLLNHVLFCAIILVLKFLIVLSSCTEPLCYGTS